ncbi:photosystem I assembly protein Ycf4 [Aphanothece sacrum]|uniref:Photosystem I assembly protein Ycf4 n=1 Tax=Aphanothece sacrum FPU1 TaxID=1920663 RepID=A0A401ID33_APHSA|nr:photosystem I assembly protein Ycf4 [Aphanothece sacrum]GBF79144.1 photosystem I assembly protein Ycf4 [Aphanothece sacrum FPU1]GBF86533.1 photosystem I assembly protein Ycf4 [Aphanothece sacrum FPU3]
MNAPAMTRDRLVFRQEVLGSRRFSNYWWAVIASMGGVGFLLAGLSSYLKVNLLLVSDTSELYFIPQGVALLFYGVAGSSLGMYLWLTIAWNLGGGYNEFNKETGKVSIFRWGFPGKNRRIEFSCPIEDVQAVRAEIQEGLNTKRKLYLKVKQRRDVPLTRVGEPITLADLENQGAELSRFLGVPLEGL